jgi:imidazoleglycerol-phosphate dehydratase/histidinol-phosphatase
MKNILFIDRDGTLVHEPPDEQVDSLDKIRLLPGVIPALLALVKAGFQCVMVSNQDGLGTSSFSQASFQISHDFILDLFASQGIVFDPIFICSHTPQDNCACRKPKTGLLDLFLKEEKINYEKSWVIGDRESDKLLAQNIGCSFLEVSHKQGWPAIAEILLSELRSAHIHRETKETKIDVRVALSGNKPNQIETPIPFFSHMLEQVAKHGGFSLQLTAAGDTEVDDHHLIEDTAIALGEALKAALGDKWGIARYGFTLPMDESLATVSIDLSGRSFCDFQAPFTREFVGGLATEMVPHFFKSFAGSLNATLHIKVTGENHHHMVEGCFKALGRALNQAITQTREDLPSTKGVL